MKCVQGDQGKMSDDQTSDSESPKRKIIPDVLSDDQVQKKRKLNDGEFEQNNEVQTEKQSPSERDEFSLEDHNSLDKNNEKYEVLLPEKTCAPSSSPQVFYTECKPCGKAFNSPPTYLQHMNSYGHWKVMGNKSFRCKVCEKTFSGPIPYNQHLKGKFHSKTLKTIELTEKFKETKQDSDSATPLQQDIKKDTDSDNSSPATSKQLCCEICQKKFSGPIPYDAHLVSKSHSKNVLKMVLASKEVEQSLQESCTNESSEKVPEL